MPADLTSPPPCVTPSPDPVPTIFNGSRQSTPHNSRKRGQQHTTLSILLRLHLLLNVFIQLYSHRNHFKNPFFFLIETCMWHQMSGYVSFFISPIRVAGTCKIIKSLFFSKIAYITICGKIWTNI